MSELNLEKSKQIARQVQHPGLTRYQESHESVALVSGFGVRT